MVAASLNYCQVEEGKWVWSDGQAWNFTDWAVGEPNSKSGSRCIGTIGDDWYARACSDGQIYPLCRIEPRTTNGTLQVDLSEKQMPNFHIWLTYNSSDPGYFEDSSLKINISWEEAGPQDAQEKQEFLRIDNQRLELRHFYQKASWGEAEELCRQKGGHLASRVSKEEQEELVNLVGSRFFWLGGSDAQQEGNWTWNDGTPWNVEYWNESEPNGRGGENCLAILEEAWNDTDCENKDTMDGFVCRLPTTMTNFWYMARLFSESKVQNVSTEKFFQGIHPHGCLSAVEEYNVLENLRKKMRLAKSKSTFAVLFDKDLPTILEAFSLVHFCAPPNIEEVMRLANFYWKHIDCSGWCLWYWGCFCSDMRSIALATMNNILSEKSCVLYNMDLVYEIFDEIHRTYNFTLGPAVLSLASKPQHKELAKKDYPFLRNYKLCLLDPQCRILANGTRRLSGNE